MKTSITKEKLNLFVLAGKTYITRAEEKSALWHALNSILPKAVKKLEKVERQKELVRLSLCKKTSTKHIDFDKEGRYQFTEDDNKSLLEKFDAIDQELVSIPTLIVSDYPESGLTYDTRYAFEGIVIPVAERTELDDDEPEE